MEIQLAVVFLTNGQRTVLRGSPHAVARNFEFAKGNAGGGEIRCTVSGLATNAVEENALWQTFFAAAVTVGLADLVATKHQLWRRKARGLWEKFPDSVEVICIFPSDVDQMIIQFPPKEWLKYPNLIEGTPLN